MLLLLASWLPLVLAVVALACGAAGFKVLLMAADTGLPGFENDSRAFANFIYAGRG